MVLPKFIYVPCVMIVDSRATIGLPEETAELTSELTRTKELISLVVDRNRDARSRRSIEDCHRIDQMRSRLIQSDGTRFT